MMGITYKWTQSECYSRRLRYIGYVINLVAQAFVYKAEYELFEETYKAYEEALEDKTMKLWELRGLINKLHYIIIYIRRTP